MSFSVALTREVRNAKQRKDPWEVLRERGRSVEVVAVVWTEPGLERARMTLESGAEARGPSNPHAEPSEEIVQIERAILQGAVRILGEFGGLQAALKRSIVLKKRGAPGGWLGTDSLQLHLANGVPLRAQFR